MIKSGENASARLRSAGTFAAKIGSHRDIAAATREARKSWNDARPYLTKTHLKEWLRELDRSQASQIELMRNVLNAQMEYMKEKTEVKLKAYALLKRENAATPVQAQPSASDGVDTLSPSDTKNEAVNNEEIRHAKNFRNLLVGLDKDLEQDMLVYGQISELLTTINQFENENDCTSATPDKDVLSQIIDRFVTLQTGKAYGPKPDTPSLEESHSRLAAHLMQDAPKRYRDLRGMLIETEMQATRLREHMT
jgi:hypothetical protein